MAAPFDATAARTSFGSMRGRRFNRLRDVVRNTRSLREKDAKIAPRPSEPPGSRACRSPDFGRPGEGDQATPTALEGVTTGQPGVDATGRCGHTLQWR